jgi:hypothetical protein
MSITHHGVLKPKMNRAWLILACRLLMFTQASVLEDNKESASPLLLIWRRGKAWWHNNEHIIKTTLLYEGRSSQPWDAFEITAVLRAIEIPSWRDSNSDELCVSQSKKIVVSFFPPNANVEDCIQQIEHRLRTSFSAWHPIIDWNVLCRFLK